MRESFLPLEVHRRFVEFLEHHRSPPRQLKRATIPWWAGWEGGLFLISGSFVLGHGRWPAIESGPPPETSSNKTCQSVRFPLVPFESLGQSHTSLKGSPSFTHSRTVSVEPHQAKKSTINPTLRRPDPLRPANMGHFLRTIAYFIMAPQAKPSFTGVVICFPLSATLLKFLLYCLGPPDWTVMLPAPWSQALFNRPIHPDGFKHLEVISGSCLYNTLTAVVKYRAVSRGSAERLNPFVLVLLHLPFAFPFVFHS